MSVGTLCCPCLLYKRMFSFCDHNRHALKGLGITSFLGQEKGDENQFYITYYVVGRKILDWMFIDNSIELIIF